MCLSWQEADGDDRLGLQGDIEGEYEGDSKGDTPDVPLSNADADNTPQYLNKALEGLPPRYTLLTHKRKKPSDVPFLAMHPRVVTT